MYDVKRILNFNFFSKDLDECESGPCQNGGTCQDKTNYAFQCFCEAGWTGTLCELGKPPSCNQNENRHHFEEYVSLNWGSILFIEIIELECIKYD